VFLADGPLDATCPALTNEVAEHFVQWMVQPPVAFFVCREGFAPGTALDLIRGNLEPSRRKALESAFANLVAALPRSEEWEVSQGKTNKPGPAEQT
jgi:hypothetical protein